MKIRLAKYSDLPSIRRIMKAAKEKMVKDGNTFQWVEEDYPEKLIPQDIDKKQYYVLEFDNIVHACFAFILGEDVTYKVIEGAWLNNHPYGTIHRLGSDGEIKNVFPVILNFCLSHKLDIRIDTHKDNKRMIHLLNKHGFVRCGVIHIIDNSDREAFQLINS